MANSIKKKAVKKKDANAKLSIAELKNEKVNASGKNFLEKIKESKAVSADAEVESVIEESKIKTPHNPKNIAVVVVRALLTFILGAVGGFYFSIASLAKSQHIYLLTAGNADVAAANNYDTRLFGTLFDVKMYMIVCTVAFLIIFIALYGGKRRYVYLAAYGLINAATMLFMNFVFLQKIPGMSAVYATMYDIHFWFILVATIMGALMFEMFLLVCSVTRFKRLENKGIVTADGEYIDDILAEGEELITLTEATN